MYEPQIYLHEGFGFPLAWIEVVGVCIAAFDHSPPALGFFGGAHDFWIVVPGLWSVVPGLWTGFPAEGALLPLPSLPELAPSPACSSAHSDQESGPSLSPNLEEYGSQLAYFEGCCASTSRSSV